MNDSYAAVYAQDREQQAGKAKAMYDRAYAGAAAAASSASAEASYAGKKAAGKFGLGAPPTKGAYPGADPGYPPSAADPRFADPRLPGFPPDPRLAGPRPPILGRKNLQPRAAARKSSLRLKILTP